MTNMRLRLSKSMRKFVRGEKARIRGEFCYRKEQNKLIDEMYQNIFKKPEPKERKETKKPKTKPPSEKKEVKTPAEKSHQREKGQKRKIKLKKTDEDKGNL